MLLANNLRDIDQDRASGKRTLTTLIGRTATRWLFTIFVLAPFVIAAYLALFYPIAWLSLLVLVVMGAPLALALALFAAEFVLHYALDYAKIHYSAGVHVDSRPRRFWALHGIDQLTHQLTYAAMIYVVLRAGGYA